MARFAMLLRHAVIRVCHAAMRVRHAAMRWRHAGTVTPAASAPTEEVIGVAALRVAQQWAVAVAAESGNLSF